MNKNYIRDCTAFDFSLFFVELLALYLDTNIWEKYKVVCSKVGVWVLLLFVTLSRNQSIFQYS